MDGTVDAATRNRVIDALVAQLNDAYVYPETAKKMEAALRERQRRAAYDAITDAQTFATVLTEDLQAVSRDKHLRVFWTPRPLPEGDPEADPREPSR